MLLVDIYQSFGGNVSVSDFRVWTILLRHEGCMFFEALAHIYQITRDHIPQDLSLDFAISNIRLCRRG
jgi:hypothetical protein